MLLLAQAIHAAQPRLAAFDYVVLVFYFVFMASMGWVFKRFIRNTSDYFRSGGEMLWWIVGAGAFMTNFSAVSFTGMAGKAYEDGPLVLVIFFGGAFGFLFNYLYFAPVFRQMRCVTAMDAVRKRFGAANEQFFTWIQIPTGMLYAAIWLNGLAVFLSAAFGISLLWTIVVTSAVVLMLTLLGGSWSTTASDFVQMLLLMPITIVAAILALMKVGGVGNFVEQVPRHFWHWGEVANSNILAVWVIAMLVQKWVVINNMTDASRYLSVKDTRHARKAALLCMILFIIGPAVWFIPPMVARIAYPDLRQVFPSPDLSNPQDASYFAIATATMPVGMIGLLISGIFASTMGQMDSGLNRNAGYFIKNFYQVQLRPHASERELLLASKVATVVFAVLIMLAALWFASMRHLTIFELMVNFGTMVALPISIPLIWGMFVRRAPSWAGWTAVLVGLLASYLTQQFLDARALGELLGMKLNAREASAWNQAASALISTVVGSAWFLLTSLFGASRQTTEVRRVDAFFQEMRTPVDFEKEEQSAGSDNLQARVMGLLCLIYGGFITLLVLIPNPWRTRWAFLFCGGVMFGVGWLLHRASRGKAAQREAATRRELSEPAAAAAAAAATSSSASPLVERPSTIGRQTDSAAEPVRT
jgi:SSS family transporter